MHFDVFSEGKSVFHSLDPRIKILFFIPLVFITACVQNVYIVACYFIFSVICIIAAKVHLRELLIRISALNIFIVLLWLTLPFSIEGKTLFAFKNLSVSVQGVMYTCVITLKANAILLLTIALIGTTDILTLAHALFHLKFPRKLVYLFIFLYRYISVLHEEYSRLINTVRLRSFCPGTNMSTLKTYAYMVGMLFINSYERSQRIYQAMTLRGFRGDFPMLRHFHLHKADMIFAAIMTAVILSGGILWNSLN